MLLYIHVPFCARRCSYCDFAIAVRRSVPSARFAELILREWELRQNLDWWRASPTVETVYFGGGTPSHVAPEALEGILTGIAGRRRLSDGAEITLEANPDDVTPERARQWRRAGINRVSLGVQSFDESALAWMHRTHTADQARAAVDVLRAAGFANLSLDLIYGLPDLLRRHWLSDLDQALGLDPDHVSLYALTVEAGTPLGKWSARGEVTPTPDGRVAEEFLSAHARLMTAGFEHYEVSNLARPGFRAVHNAGYWQRLPFIGLGPSAHSGAAEVRGWNVREWEAWRAAVEQGHDPQAGRESLAPEQVALEELYLGLRTDAGVPLASVSPDARGLWARERWAEVSAGRVRLTPEGWLRLDALVAGADGRGGPAC